jgi:hypothetical protein
MEVAGDVDGERRKEKGERRKGDFDFVDEAEEDVGVDGDGGAEVGGGGGGAGALLLLLGMDADAEVGVVATNPGADNPYITTSYLISKSPSRVVGFTHAGIWISPCRWRVCFGLEPSSPPPGPAEGSEDEDEDEGCKE